MYIYILIALLIATLAYKYDVKKCRNRRLFWENFILTLLIFVVGLRYHIGSDTVVYEWNFNTSATPLLNDYFRGDFLFYQPLWVFIMSFCKTVFGSFVAVQFFHAIVFHLLAFRFIRRTTQYTFTALLFLFILLWFGNSFEVLKESISSVIFLNSLFLLNEKKYAAYAFCGLIAIGFHAFAFVMFLLAPIVLFLNVSLWIVVCVTIYVVLQFVDFSYVNTIVMQVMAFSEIAGEKTMKYFTAEDTTTITFLGFFRWVLLGLFLPVIVLVLSDKKDDYYKKYVILWFLLLQLESKLPILYRFNNYLQLIYIVMLVNVLYNNSNKRAIRLRPVLITLSCCVLIMGYLDIYRPDPAFQKGNVSYDIRYFPYRTIFQDPVPLREAQDFY